LLQTFPSNYQFIFKENKNSFNDIARQIGNAVPPRLGKIIGMSIIKHLQDQNVI
jgi:DNA (cytosine-5)-methyltransferase 1